MALRVGPPNALYEKLSPGPGRSVDEVAESQRARIEAAMLEIVAERGLAAVKVRELAQIAGVSSRSFYQRYSGKDECFLRTHESLVASTAGRLAAAQTSESDWHEALSRTIDAFLSELQSDPRAAKLLLVDAYVAGSLALEQVRAAEQAFEARIAECFDLKAGDTSLPPQLARGMAVGVMCTARSQLSKSRMPEFTGLADDLTAWAAALFDLFQARAGDLSTSVSSHPEAVAQVNRRSQWVAFDERGLIVAALAKLAAVERYEELTVKKIHTSAGASRRKFSAHFGGVADCFQEAVDYYACNIASHLETGSNPDRSSDQVDQDPVELLCECVAQDSTLATLCFVDVLSPGAEGVSGLERFIREISGIVVQSDNENFEAVPLSEVSAAAIWGVMREEIICKRHQQLRTILPLLHILAAAPTCVSEDQDLGHHWSSIAHV